MQNTTFSLFKVVQNQMSSIMNRHFFKIARPYFVIVIVTLLVAFPSSAAEFRSSWHTMHDRIWTGAQHWANPMEDWLIKDGRLECTSTGANRNIHVLTHQLAKQVGDVTTQVRVGKIVDGHGSAGFRIGIQDEINDYRARLIRGHGINAGITGSGKLFIGPTQSKLIAAFTEFGLELLLKAVPGDKGYVLTLSAHDVKSGKQLAVITRIVDAKAMVGNIALFHEGAPAVPKIRKPNRSAKKRANNDTKSSAKQAKHGRFWFCDWRISGSKVVENPKQTFGPILYAMHTLSNSRGKDGHVMKLTAQMPPIGAKDSKTVLLQTQQGDKWAQIAQAAIHPDARTATFRVPNWKATRDTPYRVVYRTTSRDGKLVESEFTGTIRKDPIDRPLVVAGFTGNKDEGFPNVEINRNIAIHNPDVLFFSGDQIYENVGGYGIIRTPADRSILNYLRKAWLWGFSFRDVMRDRVTIVLPDDHDVYQGNIWGQGGIDSGGMAGHNRGGYAQPAQMVNAVHLAQCSHHPDFYDTKPIARGITTFYGDMVYGRVSFAIIGDRMFKSGPAGKVNTWKGRPDHMRDPKYDVSKLDKPGLELLGKRQEKFLRVWAKDWRGADAKCVLSATIFCNLANYHGGAQTFVLADLDSNGWPQSGRNQALREMRAGLAFHYAGDQHLASITHNGVDSWNDGGYAFCVPSIAAGYPRAWRPDKEGRPVQNRPPTTTNPEGLLNTGEYKDGFGNKVTVYAVGNPAAKNRKGRIPTLHDKASGYGIVRFNQAKQTITMECWRLLFDASNSKPGDQFPGWPKTIHVRDNDGRAAVGYLPTLKVRGVSDPVVQVISESNDQVVYTLRVKGDTFKPKIYATGLYTIIVGDPDVGRMKTIKHVKSLGLAANKTLTVKID
jgi:alkaline phosphatase D